MVTVLRLRNRPLLFSSLSVLLLIVFSLLYLNLDQLIKRPPIVQLSYTNTPIPRQIWQIFFPPAGTTTLKTSTLYADDWISVAPGYTYTLVTDVEAQRLLNTTPSFAQRPEIAATYNALTNPALKSDFLRYLILLSRGGIYSDVDTKPIVRLEDWLPDPERRATARLIIAPEYDETQDPNLPDMHPVQFCQWTIAAAPDHPVLERMVERALTGLRDVAARQGTSLDKVVVSGGETVKTTGPVAWTEVVFGVLQERDPSLTSYLDFAGIKAPRYYGDIVVLPAESFRADFFDESGLGAWWRKDHRALVRHFFRGAWRTVKLPG
ncbi:nucleotide-diphospho-sugar transferase [Lasiosphaeria ovina]|uniref:Nucleotide-diphospho-sugar transferase n=1 Tax=Lasiosphaeria ovina TaxID=92902 RepID=A0AAE0KG47_9PEZI|nr:nucleotide-diphospho-sugar transferase [Lasiosphaeria ovina]